MNNPCNLHLGNVRLGLKGKTMEGEVAKGKVANKNETK